MKQPPNFKIPSSQPGTRESTLDRRRNFLPGRLKTISEHGSPTLGNSRSDIHTGNYGATSVHADHIRTCATTFTSRPPPGKNVTSSGDRNVLYTAVPPSVSISLGDNQTSSEDAESGYQNSVGSPKTDHGSVTFSLSNEDDAERSVLSSKSNSLSQSVDDNIDELSNTDLPRGVPMPRIRDKDASYDESQKSQSPRHSPMPASHKHAHDNTAYHDNPHSLSFPLSTHPDSNPGTSCPVSYNTSSKAALRECQSQMEPFAGDLDVSCTESDDVSHLPTRRGSAKYAGMCAVQEEVITPEYRIAVHTEHKQDMGQVQETAVYSRPVVSARVTQLPSNRRSTLPNGAPPQLTYSRQYPISSVHAYPVGHRKNSPYIPLRVQVDSPNDQGPPGSTNNCGFRPMPAISEIHSAHHSVSAKSRDPTSHDPTLPENLSIPRDRDVIRPFERNPSNMLRLQSSGFMERGLNASATVYLNPEEDISESQMSIYDNLNYIRL